MSPTSLVSMPSNELSEDARQHPQPAPCGERYERRIALWASTTVLAIVALIVWLV